MVGTTISHYKILEKLGEGGMGVVYKAHDTKLDRDVALKFLPRAVVTNAEQRQRFEVEARAAASLSHPNITPIYAIEEAGDELFIAMEYIAGQDLKRRIAGTPMPAASAVAIAEQIALGLQAAHRRGIVHRDVKSANIMLTDEGQVKIMDFGLAKVAGMAGVTAVGSTLGTTAYMSPEQTRGEEVDQQSDIWSLGVVLYEMLTGRLPFGVHYEQAVIYAIQNSDFDPVGTIRADVPPEVEHVVNAALKKNPQDRYRNVDAMLADLRKLRGESGTVTLQPKTSTQKALRGKKAYLILGGIAFLLIVVAGLLLVRRSSSSADATRVEAAALPRLAVLPFSNLSGDPQTDFLSFALADQIIGDLAYVRTVVVRPSSMIRRFQKEPADPTTAGHILNVDYILSGNYLKESDAIRLNLELVDLKTEGILWHEQVQTKYESAFRLQDMVAEKVVNGLQLQFSPDERQHMGTDIPRNPQAYDYYLRSIALPLSLQDNQQAVALLRRSIALDSSYAPAFGELGYRLHQVGSFTFGRGNELREAEQAFLKALSLNSGLLNVLGGLTTLYTELGKTEEAFETSRRALQINPNSPDGHFGVGYVYRYAGLNEESKQEMEKAVQLDPRNPRFRSLGITYVYLGDYQQALNALDLDPGSPFNVGWKAEIYVRMGQKEQAMKFINRLLELEPEGAMSSTAAVEKAYLEGNHSEALRLIRDVEASGTVDGEQWYTFANHCGLLGDTAGSARMLQQAIDHGFFNYPFMLKDSFFDSVRGSQAFQAALQNAKAKHEAFKKRFASELATQ
jgi:eukaryotic-like serine/threonine-protein kinase